MGLNYKNLIDQVYNFTLPWCVNIFYNEFAYYFIILGEEKEIFLIYPESNYTCIKIWIYHLIFKTWKPHKRERRCYISSLALTKTDFIPETRFGTRHQIQKLKSDHHSVLNPASETRFHQLDKTILELYSYFFYRNLIQYCDFDILFYFPFLISKTNYYATSAELSSTCTLSYTPVLRQFENHSVDIHQRGIEWWCTLILY